MEALIGLLLIIGMLGGVFLGMTAIGCLIGWLLSLIDAGHTDHLWDPSIYEDDKKKQ